jgi:hypothetical protein
MKQCEHDWEIIPAVKKGLFKKAIVTRAYRFCRKCEEQETITESE